MVIITLHFLFLPGNRSLMIKFDVRFFALLFFVFLSAGLCAQKVNVSIKVTNKKNEPVPFASFTVIKRNDTLVFQQKNSDSTGIARFMLEKDVQYIIRITSVNYLPLEKGVTATPNHNFFSLIAFTSRSTTRAFSPIIIPS